jgi:hypothetical protein
MNVIRPNINNNKPLSGKKIVRTGDNAKIINPEVAADLNPPSMRGFKNVPEQSVLEGLIKRAIEALKSGIYWDRGSILNIEA